MNILQWIYYYYQC